ncbi:MAG: xanthine dehydrogenase family protein molybdopterin-binding subunit [Roseivirga sp.]|nr:xanthine dehydrogenase family protein molybdopterin-binding subunit [Roseivirga sp.]
MNRRNFIKLSGLTGGGLVLSTFLPGNSLLASDSAGVWEPNLFIRIRPDNTVTLVSTQYEIGQGTTTALAQVLADELGASWKELIIHQAEGNVTKYGLWAGTGGSYGLSSNWIPLRKAAAATRKVLIKAASEEWKVLPSTCFTEDSHVVHKPTGRKLSFGSLSSRAAGFTLSEDPELKSKSEYKLIGKSIAGPKQQKIVTGTNPYSLDQEVPGMVYAVIERVPVFGGRVQSFDDTETRKVKGVIDVYSHDGNARSEENGYWGGVRAGVVVVATSTWAAVKGRKKLKVEWDLGDNQNRSCTDVARELEAKMEVPKKRTFEKGNPDSYLKAEGATPIVHSYLNGYQVNACMEPLNATADVNEDKAEVWLGTQAPGIDQARIAKLLEIPEEQVTIHALPSGGGFGRRFFTDYTEEAVLVSQKIKKPVKLMWTREDTIGTNRYHDQYIQHWTALLDENNRIIAADYKGHLGGIGAFRALTYSIPNMGMTSIRPDKYLNGHVSWRSVAAHQWILGLESFMDEMAHQAKQDPLEFRLNHLIDADIIEQKTEYTTENLYPARLKGCLRLAADKGDWGKKSKRHSGKGIAGASYNAAYCAIVADVSLKKGKLTINKITAAIDCGLAVNPSQVKAQVEGGIVWALSAMQTEITIKNGLTDQSNFHDYQVPRMNNTPPIEVHIVDSDYVPTGAGEPSVPVTAPAILNAIFAATGKRLRRIPIDSEAFT